MLNYLLRWVVFTMLLTCDIKHILPRAIRLQKKNRMAETTLNVDQKRRLFDNDGITKDKVTKATINDYGLIVNWIK